MEVKLSSFHCETKIMASPFVILNQSQCRLGTNVHILFVKFSSVAGRHFNTDQCGGTVVGRLRQHVRSQQLQTRAEGPTTGPHRGW